MQEATNFKDLDEEAQELLEANAEARQAMADEIDELRQRRVRHCKHTKHLDGPSTSMPA